MHSPCLRPTLAALLLSSSALVSVCLAQSNSSPPPEPTAQDFAAAKAQHIARLQEELACVQAATTVQAMHACMPQHPGGHMGPPPGSH
jgi:hypothetical protein